MAAPTISETYPANNDTGIPTGITIKVYFDKGVDYKSLTDSVALFGNDFDQTSGPDQALWIDKDTGDNPFFLSSPTFKGLIPLKIELFYYDLDTLEISELGATDAAEEVSNNIGHVAFITVDSKYNASLPPDTVLNLHIIGDEDGAVGVSSRTVFDIIAGGSNGADSGSVSIYGTWIDTGAANDLVKVKITTAGDIGTAKYKWWYDSAGEGTAVTNIKTSRRYRTLTDGLQIRFTGNSFEEDDEFSFNVVAAERLTDSVKIIFTTNDGSYTEPPSSTSTPATSLPPSTSVPEFATEFVIDKSVPASGSYNIDLKNRKIVITFSKDLDPTSINDETVKLSKSNALGAYDGTPETKELSKTLTVSNNILTVRF